MVVAICWNIVYIYHYFKSIKLLDPSLDPSIQLKKKKNHYTLLYHVCFLKYFYNRTSIVPHRLVEGKKSKSRGLWERAGVLGPGEGMATHSIQGLCPRSPSWEWKLGRATVPCGDRCLRAWCPAPNKSSPKLCITHRGLPQKATFDK